MESKFKASILRRLRRREGERVSAGKWKRRGLLLAGLLVVLFFLRVWIVLFILQIGQFIFTPILPNVDDVDALFASQSTIIYDREGSELYTIHGDENRFEIPFEKMPEMAKNATIAAEDDKFYSHPGFDVDGITRAVLSELGIGHFIGGGSTITQQFVKNAYLSPEKTYWRKLQELMLALKLENHFTKDEILEMYLNRIPYGSNAYGIQAAAQTFFDKNAEELTLAESAVLAALPQAPSRYSPYGQNRDLLMGSCTKTELVEATGDTDAEPTELAVPCESIDDPDYTPGRKDYVLQRMLALKMISQSEFDQAWKESNNLKFESYRESIRAPHFVFYVRDILEEEFGKDVVERGGLRVFTTLNPNLQTKAEEVIAAQFPSTESEDGSISWGANRFGATNGSLLAVDNATGQILAMVGSRDYFEELDDDGIGNDGATNLTTRPRQPGSSFKPIAYTTGLKMGYTPASVFWDVDTNFGKGTDEYTPQNYDGTFLGPLSMRRALDYSRNIPAVKMAILVGELAIAQTAHELGMDSVKSDERYGPTIALGAAEVPMVEMVRAYSVFANGGELVDFTPILKITDSRGNLIEEFEEPKKSEVLDPRVAYLMANILSDASARPSSWNYYLNMDRPNGAKTGTANKKISEELILPGDVWTIGFTPQITAAAWMGNNDGSPMNVSGTGLTSASPIWKAFMDYAHADLPIKNFKIPEGIVQRSVSKLTGKLASATTPVNQIVVETFLDTDAPLEVDDAFVEVAIDRVSGKLPSSLTPESAIELHKFVNLHSERPYDPEWEKPVRNWIEKSYGEDSALEFSLPPTEVDDVHTAETAKLAPTITIVSPVSESTIQKSAIGVWVNVAAENGVEKVEYYRDGDLAATATSAPWKGVIPISKRLNDGDRVTITTKVYDKLYYVDSSTVEVIVGEDTQAPTVRITSPDAGAEVARNTTLLASADAFDAGGDIEKVAFYLDGSRLAEMNYPPYETPIVIDSSLRLGGHTLRVAATDTTGRSVDESISFEVVEGNISVEDFAIIFPANGATISADKPSVDVVAQINRAKFDPVGIEFIARDIATSTRTTFATLKNPSGQNFTVTWGKLTVGKYEIYFKARDASGKTIISGRNSVEIK